jgi:25S rRNA (adenine2142-N1)-methyltransferase
MAFSKARTSLFLNPNGLLYIVLPLPCINNSRYLTHDSFLNLLTQIQFKLLSYKHTKKLSFYLFRLDKSVTLNTVFPKKQINPGAARNNFSIVLQD